jgi:DNA modification methylase
MLTNTAQQLNEQWPVERFVPYARNPRKNDGAVDRMIASIQEFGFKIPILVRSDGQVVDGHLRLKAAERLGLRELPVILCDEWTPAQVKAFRLLANRSVAWADWDDELLAVEFSELKEMNFDLALTGFAPAEIQTSLTELAWRTAALTEEDALPPTPVQPVSCVGDIWVMGPHRVACGDATETEPVDRLMRGEKADMVFMDPPYNLNFNGRGSVGESWLKNARGPRTKKLARSILNDHMTDEEFLVFCTKLFSNMRRSVKDSAPVYICCSDKAMLQFRQAFEQAGLHWSCTIIWAKHLFSLSRADYHPQHEPILYGWPEGHPHSWGGRRDQGTVWNINKPRVNALHPTQKPVELIERALENSSHAGDLVLDLCCGGGSTIITCEKTMRHGRLMELDPKYVDVTVERWQDFSGQTATRESDGRSFAELKAERMPLAA